MQKTILVTGASGTVGASVVRALREHGVNIRAACRQPDRINVKGSEIETMVFDYEDPATYANVVRGIDSVFILPPPTGEGHALTRSFLTYLKEKAPNIHHMVLLSAMGIKPNDGSLYGELEAFVEGSGLPYTILRPNWFMQNLNTYYLPAIVQHRVIALPAGDAPTSFIDVRDIGAVAARCLAKETHQWESLTLTGWEALTYTQVAAALSEALGVTVTYHPLSDKEMRAALNAQHWEDEAIEEMIDLFKMVRRGQNAPISQDVNRVLGRPPLTLSQYIQDYLPYFKPQPQNATATSTL